MNAEWIRHFHTQTVSRQRGVWRLLLLNGYTSHCTYEFITYCDAQKILPFDLPPHATHLLQPLDVVLFQPYKHWHATAVDEATRTGCHGFNKIEFLAAIKSIRQLTFKSSSIKSSFRQTGLVPYNPSVVLNKLRETISLRPTTPPPQPTSDVFLKTPLTIRTLKQQALELSKEELGSPLRRKLDMFIKGSLAQANSGILVSAKLARSQAAENARRLRQNANRRSVQRGGVLYAGMLGK